MPSQDEVEPRYRAAGLLAFHLVSQVLDEARDIANAAFESERPWLDYLSMRKNTRWDLTYIIAPGEEVFKNTPGDGCVGEENAKIMNNDNESSDNTFITSTPQKNSEDSSKVEILIGQGDEDTELQNKLNKCTSMYINQLFNMSDVENVPCNDTEDNNSESIEILAQTITEIMQSCADKAFDKIQKKEEQLTDNISKSTIHSSFSFLEFEDADRDLTLYVDDEAPSCTDKVYELPQDPMTSQRALQQYDEMKQNKIKSSELYENSYLTMNRDYDQSDDDGYPILQDPKGMIMQEIELLTTNTSDTESLAGQETGDTNKQRGDLAATSGVSATSRKSGLIRRCRLQGARLLACLRGWWRRKPPARRKEEPSCGPCGRCPLSPVGRRRAATLQNQPSIAPPRVAWRFHTLSEALVHSTVWKDYSFETKPDAFENV